MSPPLAQPLYFGPVDRPLFGWLHRAADTARADIGLVLCYPFGNEAVCIHRTYRHCAETVANAGIPALRFDYQGTGDSAGEDTDPAQLSAWIDSVRSAVTALRQSTGVERVCLLGTRLGATIATLAAQGMPEVSALIAIAPAVSGRRYLRELRALALARPQPPPPDTHVDNGRLEAAGFAMTAATQTELASVDLLQVAGLSLTHAYILQRDDLADDEAFRRHLDDLGVAATQESFAGYVEMLLDPHDAVVPPDLLQKILAWIQRRNSPGTATSIHTGVDPGNYPDAQAHMPLIRETATFLDESRKLFAIVSEPESTAPGRPADRSHALLLLNSGAVHHIGPNRLYVTLARALAAQGVTVIRLDIAGIGDSPAKSGQAENVPYPTFALEDIARAAAYARSILGATELHLAGICSGGYHSLKAAVRGEILRSITIINPLTFFWKQGMSLAQPDSQITAEANRYRGRVIQPSAWLKMLRGQVDVRAAADVMRRRLAMRGSSILRELARRLGMTLGDDLAADLGDVGRRGTRIHFVFSAGDPGLPMLREQGGRAIAQLQRNRALGIDVIQGADHTFTTGWARQQLLQDLSKRFVAGNASIKVRASSPLDPIDCDTIP